MAIIQPHPRAAAAAPALRPGARAAGWAPALARALGRAGELLLSWQERTRQRHRLAALSDHMLRDIGLTRADIEAETSKRFWQR